MSEEIDGFIAFSMDGVSSDHGIAGHRVFGGHLVEDLPGEVKFTALGVHINECIADGKVGIIAGTDGIGV